MLPDPPLRRTPPPLDRPSAGPPKISRFFFFLPPFSFFFSLSGDLLVSFFLSLGVCLVEFWWCFWSVGSSNVLVFALRLYCETPVACRPPGASTRPGCFFFLSLWMFFFLSLWMFFSFSLDVFFLSLWMFFSFLSGCFFSFLSGCFFRFSLDVFFVSLWMFFSFLSGCFFSFLSGVFPHFPFLSSLAFFSLFSSVFFSRLWSLFWSFFSVFWSFFFLVLRTLIWLGALSSKLQKKTHPKTLSSKKAFSSKKHFHPKTGSSNDTFIQKRFRAMTLSSQTIFIHPEHLNT